MGKQDLFEIGGRGQGADKQGGETTAFFFGIPFGIAGRFHINSLIDWFQVRYYGADGMYSLADEEE